MYVHRYNVYKNNIRHVDPVLVPVASIHKVLYVTNNVRYIGQSAEYGSYSHIVNQVFKDLAYIGVGLQLTNDGRYIGHYSEYGSYSKPSF